MKTLLRSFAGVLLWALLACTASATPTHVYLTSGTTWSVPSDWDTTTNTIECLGAGGDGSAGTPATNSGAGGGSGGYAIISNTGSSAIQAGDTLTIQVGAHGSGNTTLLKNRSSTNILLCNAGGNASGTGHGNGPATTGEVGSTKLAGCNGGNGSSISSGSHGAGAGAGSPGPVGACKAAGSQGAGGGGGGGGADGGSSSIGADATTTTGGDGGDGTDGTGHGTKGTSSVAATSGSPGKGAGGGGGSTFAGHLNGGDGSCDTAWDSTHGPCGGGGGAGPTTGNGGTGGAYGGGGGGGAASGTGGVGGGGIIVVTYTPVVPPAITPRLGTLGVGGASQ